MTMLSEGISVEKFLKQFIFMTGDDVRKLEKGLEKLSDQEVDRIERELNQAVFSTRWEQQKREVRKAKEAEARKYVR